MRIAIGIWGLTGFGGTESYSLTVAAELERLGHDVWIYSPEGGPCADFAIARGMRVVREESQLPDCAAVLAQDAVAAYVLARRFPDAVRVMVAHAGAYPLQSPPQIPDVCQAVVVMNDRFRRRTEALAWHPQVVRLRQPIDLQRFSFRAMELEQSDPPRVLLLSNHIVGTRRRMIEAACEPAGLTLTHTGVTGVPTASPEYEIAAAEIVITLGRGAIEAMASGKGTYVLGHAGGDGWVTEDTYPAIEAQGFSGRAFDHATSVERLANDLSKWHEEMGEIGRDLAVVHHDVQAHALQLLGVFDSIGTPASAPPTEAGELARLVRIEWESNTQAKAWAAQAAVHRAEVAIARGQAAEAQAQAANARAEADEAARQAAVLHTHADALRGRLAASEAETDRLRGSIDAINGTRTMRWTEVARALYGHARRLSSVAVKSGSIAVTEPISGPTSEP